MVFATCLPLVVLAAAGAPDLIVHNGKIITVDREFSVRRAMAVKDGRIVRLGDDAEVLATKGDATRVIDLAGRTVLPGLIDSHVHPSGAAMTEFDHDIPPMETVADVLAYVRSRAEALDDGEWIELSQVFITRLREQRYPTRAELDAAAPKNPVVFSTGPDASLNTLALRLSGIDKDFKVDDGGPGYAEKDPQTGEPTGILRGCTRYVKSKSPKGSKRATEADRYRRTIELFRDYLATGLTTVCDRKAPPDAIPRYQRMLDAGELPVRLAVSAGVETIGPMESIRGRIRAIATSPLRKDDPMLRIIGVKIHLDGGMLTGSAYMRQPWRVSQIYSITDPDYRGVLLVPHARLVPMVRETVEAGMQFTAHAVGDGAVHELLDTYEQVARELPDGEKKLRETRSSVTHSNFMSKEAIDQMRRLGVSADVQPIWLYLDARTLKAQFGDERLRYFQPWRSLFEAGVVAGGGSDHMQKIGARRAINPYDPFQAMWVAITRKARWFDGQLHPEEALTREQAIRLYTTNNAWLLFKEHQVGSLEPGKFADFIVADRDVLTCPEDDIADTKVLRTFLDGKQVFARE